MMTVHLFEEILCNNKNNHNGKSNHVENINIQRNKIKQWQKTEHKSKLQYVKIDAYKEKIFKMCPEGFLCLAKYEIIFTFFSIFFKFLKNNQIFHFR